MIRLPTPRTFWNSGNSVWSLAIDCILLGRKFVIGPLPCIQCSRQTKMHQHAQNCMFYNGSTKKLLHTKKHDWNDRVHDLMSCHVFINSIPPAECWNKVWRLAMILESRVFRDGNLPGEPIWGEIVWTSQTGSHVRDSWESLFKACIYLSHTMIGATEFVEKHNFVTIYISSTYACSYQNSALKMAHKYLGRHQPTLPAVEEQTYTLLLHFVQKALREVAEVLASLPVQSSFTHLHSLLWAGRQSRANSLGTATAQWFCWWNLNQVQENFRIGHLDITANVQVWLGWRQDVQHETSCWWKVCTPCCAWFTTTVQIISKATSNGLVIMWSRWSWLQLWVRGKVAWSTCTWEKELNA